MDYLNNSAEYNLSLQQYIEASGLSFGELESLRLILTGNSIIDWHRLNLNSREEVDTFLRVNRFDPSSIEDKRRFRYLHQEAVQYLTNHFNLRFPEKLLEPEEIQDLFLHASFAQRRFNRYQLLSCVILKVMSILHHIEARSLLFRTPISDFDLFRLVQDQVDLFQESAQQAGVPIVHIYGSRKSRDSLITKLLSKKDTLAATIFDKVRYRIVIEDHRDILPVLAYMTRTFVPFNYCIPNESTNNLVDLAAYIRTRTDLHPRMDGILSNYKLEPDGPVAGAGNVFSGSTYRMINFIVDLPVRIDSFLTEEDVLRFGRIAFVLVEFQIVDHQTEEDNERGENNHEMYKKRQRDRVLERLRWGRTQRPRIIPGTPEDKAGGEG